MMVASGSCNLSHGGDQTKLLTALFFFFFFFERFGGTLPLFWYIFYINRAYIQYFIYDTRRVPLLFSSFFCFCSVEGHLWGAEPRFELGPAVQQADALLSEPRRTLTEPRRTLLRRQLVGRPYSPPTKTEVSRKCFVQIFLKFRVKAVK